MATAVVSFRWLDILEADFDKAYVEIDGIIPEIDCDEVELIDLAKSKLATLSSAFAQLVHKAQTIFQNNAKLEAQVLDYRDKLSNCRCQNESEVAQDASDISSLDQVSRLERKCELLKQENTTLTHQLLSLQGEVYGARLASKYLDKELAGRIQQLQLLTQPKMNLNAQNKLWKQIESEIFLHRHKTVSRACRGQITQQKHYHHTSKGSQAENLSREVKLTRRKGESLGISVTGGSENGLPILVSKIHPDSVADESGLISAGDSLLAVNSTDLRGSSLSNAVRVLSEVNGEFTLHLHNSLSEEEELLDTELQYPILGEEVGYKPTHMSLEKLNSLTSKSTESIDLKPPSDSKSHKFSTVKTNGTTDSASKYITSSSDTITSNKPSPSTTTDSSSEDRRQNVGQYTFASVQSLEDNQNPVFNSHE